MLPATDSVRLGMIQAAVETATAGRNTNRSFYAQSEVAGRRVSRVTSLDDQGAGAVPCPNASASTSAQRTNDVAIAASSAPDEQQSQAQLQSPQEGREPPIEEMVNNAVIHLDKPIEHIPVISPPELKLIGRCVTFIGDTTINGESSSFFYKGLVGTINKETVMLIHVYRYTEEDFQLHKLEHRQTLEIHENLKSSAPESAVTSMNNDLCDFSNGNSGGTAREETEANHHNNNLDCVRNTIDADNIQNSNGNGLEFGNEGLSVAEHQEMLNLLNELGETHAEVAARVRNRMREQMGTMGPIPYVTFSRSHIHHVEFGVDPKSSFYSIFQDPMKEHFDMQCLRMFVRRYIIHTSQGNNPRQVPLRAFITSRCNCPDLNDNLLVSVTREELAHLIKIDRDVRRIKKKKEQIRRNALRAYRAPNGLFRLTGILFLTHMPQQTFTIAAMELLMTLVMLLYMIITVVTAESDIIAPYFAKVYSYVLATIIISVLAAGCTSLHALRMTLPIRERIYLSVLRVFFALGVIACSTTTMIIAGERAGYERFLRFADSEDVAHRLCNFYSVHRCSGLDIPCTSIRADLRFCDCPTMTYDSYPCETFIITYIQRGLIPIVCIAFILFATFFFDNYLHVRLFHIAHLLQRRL
nr:unnamed protein product [Leishmania braziliensis]